MEEIKRPSNGLFSLRRLRHLGIPNIAYRILPNSMATGIRAFHRDADLLASLMRQTDRVAPVGASSSDGIGKIDTPNNLCAIAALEFDVIT